PLPKMAEPVQEPPRPPDPKPVAAEPPPDQAPTAASAPPAAVTEPAPSARPTAHAALAAVSDAPSTPTDGIPIGRPVAPPPSPPVAAIPSDAGPADAITHYARPRGGYQIRPSYPSTARRLGIQGTTVLKVHVLIDGRIGDVVVQESAGHP